MEVLGVSVVIPHYEKQAALRKVLSELLIQVQDQDEIIIVDDHSPGGVGACKCNSDIRILRPPQRPHVYRLNTLRNTGTWAARNDAVAILDPDCIPNRDFIENARKIYDPSVLFTGRIDYLDADGQPLKPDPRTGPSRWVDQTPRGGGMIWGAIMFFSRSRASLIGLFDTSYDGGWGADDSDFGEKCYSSGMRLRYEPALSVKHQWHPKKKPNQDRNYSMWQERRLRTFSDLNHVSPYRPAVAVLIATVGRPYYIDQVMRGVFRSRIPVKVRLVNQGDHSFNQTKALDAWRGRWAVEMIDLPELERLSVLRTQVMVDYAAKKFRYLVLSDDDILPRMGSLEALIRAMEEHPEYHSIAGGVCERGKYRMLGGYIVGGQHYNLPLIKGVVETAFVSSGFTAIRLDPLIPYDTEYRFGWNDWDWSNEVRKQGLKVAVCGEALAYHRYLAKPSGFKTSHDGVEYLKLRSDAARNNESASRFMSKWGYMPKASLMWDKHVGDRL